VAVGLRLGLNFRIWHQCQCGAQVDGRGILQFCLQTDTGQSISAPRLKRRHLVVCSVVDIMMDQCIVSNSFAVFGCADIAHVPNAVVKRHGNTVVVKCNYNGQSYLLTCSDNRWKGNLANCSKGSPHNFPFFIFISTSNTSSVWMPSIVDQRVCMYVCLFFVCLSTRISQKPQSKFH